MWKPTLLLFLLAGSPAAAQPEVIARGLPGAVKFVLTRGGNFLVSQPSMAPNAGKVTLVTRSGDRRSLIEGLPSGVEVTLAGTSGPSAMVIRDRTLYLALGAGDSERRGTPPTLMHNPAGSSSPLFASILEWRFLSDIDSVSSPFRLTAQHQQILTDGGQVDITNDSGASVQVSLLTRFPVSEPAPNILYRFANPWGMALSEDGRSLFVTDASVNSLAKVDLATGRWRRFARFPPIPNPTPVGPPVVDAVPTNVRLYGDELLVSFLAGFPFVPGSARVLAVNRETGAASPFIFGVTSATDVFWRNRADGSPEFYVLEFSTNQSAMPPPPGRLVRFDSSGMRVVAAPLITPTNMVYDESTRELYILELRGQIVRVALD